MLLVNSSALASPVMATSYDSEHCTIETETHPSICIDNRVHRELGLMQSSQLMSRQVWIPFRLCIDSSPLSSPSLHSVSRLLFVSMGTSFNVWFICISEAHKKKSPLNNASPTRPRTGSWIQTGLSNNRPRSQCNRAINWQRKLTSCNASERMFFFFFSSNPQFNKTPLWHEF